MTTCSITDCIRPVERGRDQCSAHRKAAQRAAAKLKQAVCHGLSPATDWEPPAAPSRDDARSAVEAPSTAESAPTSSQGILGHPDASQGRAEPPSALLDAAEPGLDASEASRESQSTSRAARDAELSRYLGFPPPPRSPEKSSGSRNASRLSTTVDAAEVMQMHTDGSSIEELILGPDGSSIEEPILGKPRVQKTNDCLVDAARLPGQQAAEDAQVPEALPEFLLRRLRRRAWSPFS